VAPITPRWAPRCPGHTLTRRSARPRPASAAGQHIPGIAPARQAAAGGDVRIRGGPSTIREFLAAGLIDYLHIVVVPIVLGRGERLWDGLEGLEDRFQVEAVNSPSGVTHVTLSRR
jgi:dihydrofolate reductase